MRLAREPVARVIDLVRRVVGAFPAEALAAHDLDQEFGAILFTMRTLAFFMIDVTALGPWLELCVVVHALHRQAHRCGVHHVVGDAGAQVGIGDATLVVGADIVLGDLVERARVARRGSLRRAHCRPGRRARTAAGACRRSSRR